MRAEVMRSEDTGGSRSEYWYEMARDGPSVSMGDPTAVHISIMVSKKNPKLNNTNKKRRPGAEQD